MTFHEERCRMRRAIQCPHCPRKFVERGDVYQHIKAKHGGKGKSAFKLADDEPSFAERAIQASIDHACGIANDDYDWLVEPFE